MVFSCATLSTFKLQTPRKHVYRRCTYTHNCNRAMAMIWCGRHHAASPPSSRSRARPKKRPYVYTSRGWWRPPPFEVELYIYRMCANTHTHTIDISCTICQVHSFSIHAKGSRRFHLELGSAETLRDCESSSSSDVQHLYIYIIKLDRAHIECVHVTHTCIWWSRALAQYCLLFASWSLKLLCDSLILKHTEARGSRFLSAELATRAASAEIYSTHISNDTHHTHTHTCGLSVCECAHNLCAILVFRARVS